MLFKVPTGVASNYHWKSLLPRQNIEFKMPAVCNLIVSSMEKIFLWCSLLLPSLGDPGMKDHINPNRHITSMVNLCRYIQMLWDKSRKKIHAKNKMHLNSPQNFDAHHKSSPLPRVVLQLPESLKGDLTCRSFSEDSKVALSLTGLVVHPY